MFLVASRSFQDPDFQGSVVYLLQHDDHGSLGIIVNRPTPVRLADWQPDLEGTRLAALPLYDGGPVNPENLLTLFENPAWEKRHDRHLARHVLEDVYASVRAGIVAPILQDGAGNFRRVRCYIGHIGWLPGQLEQEIGRHDWHLVAGDIDAVFGPDTATLWQRLIERLEAAPPSPLPGAPQGLELRRGPAAVD